MATTTTTQNDNLRDLYKTLAGRSTPEAIWKRLVDLEIVAAPAAKAVRKRRRRKGETDYDYERNLRYEAQWATRQAEWDKINSEMPTTFEHVSSLAKPATVLAQLLGLNDVGEEEGRDPQQMRALVDCGKAVIAYGSDDPMSFKEGRFNREQRQEKAVGGDEPMSRRRYDKLFRLISRLDGYVPELIQQTMMFEMARFAKTGFATRIPWELFSADLPTAAFVAYYTANLGRRSLFTNQKQARALDDKSAELLKALEGREETRWLAVAAVLPRQDILAHLSAEDRYVLLDWTRKVLEDAAEGLRVAAEKNSINRETMIVQKGNDSSTWNALAGSWNRARDSWLALTFSLGAGSMFQEFLPGKVMRLMAADVAYWHRATGGKLEPNTHVWSILPPPWEVLQGTARCGTAEVIAACEQAKVNPEKTGWTVPREWTAIDTWRPTPETVHGVTVSSPELATFLRKVGVFSGKSIKKNLTAEEQQRTTAGWLDNAVVIEESPLAASAAL